VSNKQGPKLRLVLLALSLSALFAAGAMLSWLGSAGTRSDESLAFAALASDKTLGMNADLSGLDPADMEQSLAAMESAGFRWLRQRFAWDAIEISPGVYDWGAWDAIVEGAARHNLELLAVLDGTPAWARADVDAGNALAPPAESRGFGDFVTVFATRYGDQIDYYQIWDEPNITPHSPRRVGSQRRGWRREHERPSLSGCGLPGGGG